MQCENELIEIDYYARSLHVSRYPLKFRLHCMFDEFITAAQRRARAYQQPNAEEEETQEAEQLVFSIPRIVDERGPDYICDAISLTWEEFLELDPIVKPSMEQNGRGRRPSLARIDRFSVLMLYLTSRCTIKRIALSLNLSPALTMHSVQGTLCCIEGSMQQFFPSTKAEVRCERTFDNHPEVFGIADASPAFIRRPDRHQEDNQSGKYRRHCVKVQALVTADGQCLHLSKVYRRSTHNKAIFDRSGLADFTSCQPPGSAGPRHRIIMGDLGNPRTCPGATLQHTRPARGELPFDQKRHSRAPSRDRIIVEIFFGGWKTLFGIYIEVFRGEIKFLAQSSRSRSPSRTGMSASTPSGVSPKN
jgi:hypothetical protein